MSKFIEELKELYPEKVIVLMGMKHYDESLSNYVKENDLNIHSFNPHDFKLYITELNKQMFELQLEEAYKSIDNNSNRGIFHGFFR
jgi:hypothetical protein